MLFRTPFLILLRYPIGLDILIHRFKASTVPSRVLQLALFSNSGLLYKKMTVSKLDFHQVFLLSFPILISDNPPYTLNRDSGRWGDLVDRNYFSKQK